MLLGGAAGVCALALAGPAVAAYDPSLVVFARSAAPAARAPVVFALTSGTTYRVGDEVTGKATLYAPRGYAAKLDHPVGTTLGTVEVFLLVGGTPAGAQFGTVKTDDPANHLGDACAPGRHDAVWILEVTFAGSRVRVPVYVDRIAAGPEALYASARMLVCLPPVQGGVTVKDVIFGLSGVFANPTAGGTYAWNAVFVPYAAGTAVLNPTGAVQSTSSLRLPVSFTVTAGGRGGRVLVRACVREAGLPVRGASVKIFSGFPSRRGVRQLAAVRTNRRGCASASLRSPKKGIPMFATATIGLRRGPACAPTLAPRCSRASFGGVGPVIRAIKVRR